MNNMRNKILSLLVLLLTAATGAWADELATEYSTSPSSPLSNVTVTADMDITIDDVVTVTINNGLTIATGKTLTVRGGGTLIVNGAEGSTGNAGGTAISGDIIVKGATVQATGGQGGIGVTATRTGGTGGQGGTAISGTIIIYSGTITATGGKGGTGGAVDGHLGVAGNGGNGGYAIDGPLTVYGGNVTAQGGSGGQIGSGAQPGSEGAAANAFASDVTFEATEYTMKSGNTDITTATGYHAVNISAADTTDPNDILVTISTNKKEATFAMPAYDATATYELVRDMAYEVTAYVGTDPNADYRHRLKKVNNQFVPDGITTDAQIIALFPVIDVIDAQNPKRLNYGTDFTVTIIDGNQNEYAIDQFSFAPGTYSVKVTGIGDYDGQIESLNTFELYYGYEVPVPSKEYVTYRSETEKLAIDTESGAKMYTVRGASSSAVTVSEETSVDAGLGILLYNPTDNDVTALLIPTETAMANAPQSDGTWSTVIGSVTASDDWDNYICNGYQFVITRGSGTLPANRWALALKKNQQQNARAINIVFDDATGISTTNFTNYTNEAWYDLNGRKLNGKPNRKGVYIMNGKKVLK